MFLIDTIACQNPLRGDHPFEKFIFSLSCIIIALIPGAGIAVAVVIFLVMSLLLLCVVRVNIRVYLKFLAVPFFFIILSILPVLFSVSHEYFSGYPVFTIFGFWFGVAAGNPERTLSLAARAFAATVSFYFFVLSTPVADCDYLLQKLKLPQLFREIVMLVYRFIFIVVAMADCIYTAQKARMGYCGVSVSVQSAGRLISSLLLKSISFGERSYQALLSRGYTGELKVMCRQYSFSLRNWVVILFVDSVLLSMVLWTK